MVNLGLSSKYLINTVEKARTIASRGVANYAYVPVQSLPKTQVITNSVANGKVVNACKVLKDKWNGFTSFLGKKVKGEVKPAKLSKQDCNIIKLPNSDVSEVLKISIGNKPYRIATSGYSFNTEGYEKITKEFLSSIDEVLGRKNTGYIYPPTLEKGSIYDITAQVSGLDKGKALFATAEDYFKNFNLEQLSENVNLKKYVKTPTMIFPNSEIYTEATANASNVLVCTGGRKVAVKEIAEALKRKHKVVLLHNLNLKNGTFNKSLNEVENAARFFDDLRLSGVSKYSEAEMKELKALLEQPDVINDFVRIYLVNDEKSAAEAGKRAAEFIKRGCAISNSVPSIEKVKTMTLSELRDLAKARNGVPLMKKAGVVLKETEQRTAQTLYGQIKHKQIKTPDGQVVASKLIVNNSNGKESNILQGISQEVLQTPATEHIHPINWSTINPDAGVVVTQKRTKPVIARKIVTEGTLENSLIANNSNNVPLRYDVVTGTQYIDTPYKRQSLTGDGLMVVYSSSQEKKQLQSGLKKIVNNESAKKEVKPLIEDRSFMPADIASNQYEIITETGERIPCNYEKMVSGIDYKIAKKEGEKLKMAVPPSEVISSEGEILAPNKLYMVDSKGHFYDGNPIKRIKRGEIEWQADMNNPAQAQIKKLINESLRLEKQAKMAKKAGKKDLAKDLLGQAKQLTIEAEVKMTEWVKSAQCKSNAGFFA